ncbi:hypothetical protein [Streptobacillus canis]|uniref:hypothetical protein n=1 Tax=Streptobacillus canis TaxID=2678686 RepID=UPI0012E13E50|nr:hypothetical protein [Streptobacillus canis]
MINIKYNEIYLDINGGNRIHGYALVYLMINLIELNKLNLFLVELKNGIVNVK